MGCNCGKNRQAAAQPRRMEASGITQQFVLQLPSGEKQTYGSRLEADAANVRQGYRGIVKPVGGNQ